jgi:hypothetical protein
MNGKKLYRILTGALALLAVGLLVSVYGANSMLNSKSNELVTQKAANLAAAEQEKELGKAKKDIATYGEMNEIAKSVVPQDKDQAKTVSEIVDLASQSGIARLSSVSFPPSTLGGVTSVKTLHGLTQVTPVKGMAGVYTLQITVTQADTEPVPFNSFVTFLSKLERNRRTALVSSINVQPNPDRPDLVSFTLVIDEYIKP